MANALFIYKESIPGSPGPHTNSPLSGGRTVIGFAMRKGSTFQSLLIPKDWGLRGIDWMENGESVVFSGNKVKLNAPPDIEEPPTNIYKYHLATGKTTRLTEHLGIDHTLDWVSDSARAVSPAGKRPMQWGALRSFIPAYRVVFKAVSVSIKNLME